MTRFIDGRGRLFGKVNVVDLLVLLVIIAVVVFAVMRFTTNPDTAPVQMKIVVRSVDNRTLEPYKNTGQLQDAGGNLLGMIVGVEVTPSLLEVATPAGELKVFDSFTKSDVWIIVRTTGYLSDSTVHVGRTAARVGALVKIVGPGYEGQANIADVVWGAEAVK